MRGLNLQSKFILITALAIILLMGVIGYLVVEREKTILHAEAKRQGRLLGETLAIPIINDLIYERLGLVEEGGLLDNYILEIFNKREVDLLYLTILDEEGKVVSHNDIAEYGKRYTDPLTLKALNSTVTTIQQFSAKGHDALDFGVPLSIGKKRWGTLKFALSLRKVEQEIIDTVRKIVMLTLFFIGIGFVLIIFLSKRFISPITHLANTMERAGADDLGIRVDIKGNDELSLLGERFNSMMERIRQANEEIRRTHERLIQSEKLASVGILAAGLAHEINNPLGALFNCHYLLQQEGDNPVSRARYLSFLGEGLEKIENTINKLLWMSRKSEHSPVDVNIRNTIESVFSFAEYKLKKSNIEFINEVSDNLRATIDPHDFQQLLLNLFINAIHAMENGGVLRVSGCCKDSLVQLRVADTGSGIASENLGKIFDPFFTTKPVGEGTGLGLWLSYEITKNNNGHISVESEIGKGTAFVLTFPVSASL